MPKASAATSRAFPATPTSFSTSCPSPTWTGSTGLSPALAIDQKGLGRSPRSTVGTVTEIYNFLRLLFARCGTVHCPDCRVPAAGPAAGRHRGRDRRPARRHPLLSAGAGGARPQGRAQEAAGGPAASRAIVRVLVDGEMHGTGRATSNWPGASATTSPWWSTAWPAGRVSATASRRAWTGPPSWATGRSWSGAEGEETLVQPRSRPARAAAGDFPSPNPGCSPSTRRPAPAPTATVWAPCAPSCPKPWCRIRS